MTKIKFEKAVTLFVDNIGETNYGIKPIHISIAVKPVSDFRNRPLRICIQGQWYKHDNGPEVVIALKIPSQLYLTEKYDDEFEYELEFLNLYRKFCKKSEAINFIKCEKDRLLLFLKETFKVTEEYNNANFCKVAGI